MSGREIELPMPEFTEMPLPPTAGQILGLVIKHLGGLKPPFDGKQFQRVFGASDDYKIALETKAAIVDDIAQWVMEIGLIPGNRSAPDYQVFAAVSAFLTFHISDWEWWRANLFEHQLIAPRARSVGCVGSVYSNRHDRPGSPHRGRHGSWRRLPFAGSFSEVLGRVTAGRLLKGTTESCRAYSGPTCTRHRPGCQHCRQLARSRSEASQ